MQVGVKLLSHKASDVMFFGLEVVDTKLTFPEYGLGNLKRYSGQSEYASLA